MKNLILIFMQILIVLSCTRSHDDNFKEFLPQATQIGANTFGVKISGNIHTPKSSQNDLSNIGYPQYNGIWEDFSYDNGKTFAPLVYLSKVNATRMILRINDVQGITPKEYIINGQDESVPIGRVTIGYLISQGTSLQKQYNAVANSGSIIITKNDANIISGTFSGKLSNISNPNDILEITDGRFDFNKNTINNYKFP